MEIVSVFFCEEWNDNFFASNNQNGNLNPIKLSGYQWSSGRTRIRILNILMLNFVWK